MALDITPPGSVRVPPLTPPPTEEKPLPLVFETFGLIRRHFLGDRLPGFWKEYYLKPEDYVEVQRRLERDKALQSYEENKVRRVNNQCSPSQSHGPAF